MFSEPKREGKKGKDSRLIYSEVCPHTGLIDMIGPYPELSHLISIYYSNCDSNNIAVFRD